MRCVSSTDLKAYGQTVNTKNLRFPALFAATALVIGFLHILPDIKFIRARDSGYNGINFIGFTDQLFYTSRINGVYRGDFRLSDVGIYEYRNGPVMLSPLPEIISAGLGLALGLDISGCLILLNFISPVVFFLFAFTLAYLMSGSRWAGYLAAVYLALGMFLLSSKFLLGGNFFANGLTPLLLNRPISQQFNFPYYLLVMTTIRLFLEHRSPLWKAVAGLAVGSLFYITIYYWTFVYASMAILFLYNCFYKKNYTLAWKILAVLFLSSLLSIPYWLQVKELTNLSQYAYITQRYGLFYSREPYLPLLHVLMAVFFSLSIYIVSKRDVSKLLNINGQYIIAFVIGGLICLNQQVIIGKTLQSSHWQGYTNKMFNLLALFVTGYYLYRAFFIRRFGSNLYLAVMVKTLYVLLVVLPFVHAYDVQDSFYKRHYTFHKKLQATMKPIKWLAENTDGSSVVLADLPTNEEFTELADLITTYGYNYIYSSETFFTDGQLPKNEVQYRVLAAMRFFCYSMEEMLNHRYIRKLNGTFIFTKESYPEDQWQEDRRYIVELFGKMLKLDRVEVLKKYRVDYVLATKNKAECIESRSGVGKDGLKRLYDDSNYVIYRVQ